jgi:hypothetical protein
VVRQVARTVRQQGASPQAIPRMIRRTVARVARSPRAVARLARPNSAARRLRVRAARPLRPGLRRRLPRVIRIPRGAPVTIQIAG